MRLTKVELHGFKSFADRVSFEFDEGITAILGPNGCGKSNIVDAIKWVLGESRPKNLRGEEMADVIFAGSERRRPSGVAEVNLYFSNEDGALPVEYREVCITRRLYRSGESEYLINRQPCRRRDIRDLFLDTGIGTSAYSVIEQGRVEALLQAKPEERRLVFEEAAGVSKYKARRKETLARLERTQQYLDRVRDVVDEVERNIRRVHRQAASARRYQRLQQELHVLKALFYARGYRALTDEWKKVEAERMKLESLLAEEAGVQARLTTEILTLAEREQALTEMLERQEQDALLLQETLGATQAELSRLEAQLDALEKESAETVKRSEELRTRLAHSASDTQDLTVLIEKTREEADAMESELRAREEERVQAQRCVESAEAAIHATRDAMLSISDRRSELRGELAKLESRASATAERREAIENHLRTLEEESYVLGNALRELTASREKIADAVQILNARLREFQELERRHRDEAQALSQQQAACRSERAGLASRRQTLEDLEKHREGTFAGVKAILEAKERGAEECREVLGMAVDLMRVGADVAVAIETALGPQAQDVIVETAYGAQRCIEYLKREEAGRATFLPLDRIRGRARLDASLRHLPGVVGEAIDLVSFDRRYQAAFEYLLAGILVVDTLDTARRLSAEEARGVRIVTLEGDVIHPSGAMTGGHGKRRGGLVTRKAEIDAITDALKTFDAKLSDLEARREAAYAAAEQARREAGEVEKALQETVRQGQEVERDLSVRKSELARIEQEKQALGTERNAIAEAGDASEERRITLQQELQELEGKEEELRRLLETRLTEGREARARNEAAAERAMQVRERRADLLSRIAEWGKRLHELTAAHEERIRELQRCEERVEAIAGECLRLVEAKQRLEAEVATDVAERDRLRKAVDELRQEVGRVRAELQERREEERTLQKRLQAIAESETSLKMKEQEVRLKRDAVVEKAREELGIHDLPEQVEAMLHAEKRVKERGSQEASSPQPSESEALASSHEAGSLEEVTSRSSGEDRPTLPLEDVITWSEEELLSRIHDLTQKIEKIGPVNLCAIEELAELEARAAFLHAEKEDIERAAKDLTAVVERLSAESSKKFQETFEVIRQNFQETFKMLFGGGKADLVLESVGEGEDPLDAGIEILARPPGKETKSISLLSGGEKALCAVALLFALFRTKPTPFCILDEVDGPLDESNIDRFMSMVREFSTETQFILISHNKRTMGLTDAIYGVTQDEPGVTTKYSLRFTSTYGQRQETSAEMVLATAVAG